METEAASIRELRAAFTRSGLWRDGWSYLKAIATPNVERSLHMQVIAHRKYLQQHGKPAPLQQALF